MKTYFHVLLLLSITAVTLLSGCASPNFDMASTPLQIALGQADESSGMKPRKPDFAKVKTLVEGGADVNFVNSWGSSLHAASRHATPEIIDYLIAHGANINLKDNGGFTPLIWAARSGKLENVKLLVAKGANVNAVASVGDLTPLSGAAFSGQYEIVAFLISKGADISPQAAGAAYLEAASGMANLLKAEPASGKEDAKKIKVKYEFVAILELLMAKGANINSVDKYGVTALHKSAVAENPQVTRYFIKAGVNPKMSSSIFGTPLEYAQKTRDALLSPTLQNQSPSSFSTILDKETISDKDLKKLIQGRVNRLNEVIAILTPVTNSAASIPENASILQVSLTQGSSVGGQVQETLVGCAKLKASLYVCEKMPWPASTGCSALAKSQFSNSVCN